MKLLRQAAPSERCGSGSAPSPVTPSMRPTESPTLWLRTFPLDGGDELRIWEDPRGTLAGGNGATCWDSALAFATAVSSSGDDDDSVAATTDWRGLRVLELGSGCGLVALALACRGANVIATERAIALPLLATNVAANAALIERRGGSVAVVALDWTTPDADVLNRGYDAVVGADLCFAANAEGAAALARPAGHARRGDRNLAQEIRERTRRPPTSRTRGGAACGRMASRAGATCGGDYELAPLVAAAEALPAVPSLAAEAPSRQ